MDSTHFVVFLFFFCVCVNKQHSVVWAYPRVLGEQRGSQASYILVLSLFVFILFYFISRASVFGCSLSKLPGATRPSCSLISLLELRVEIYPASPSFSSLFIGIGTEKKREENSPVGIYKQKEP